ncbi:NTP transferase domain-containing protein [Candidatus Woesearchaeota archaeon]|nr:NTP transferase domain-containing protein [Candidatus Woesearchaeota archaeon]
MKGVIVSAGLGTRLRPITNIISKNLLPVYNKPMIYYGIETLKKAGVTELLLVVNKMDIDQYKTLIRNGEEFNIPITYTIQEEQKGTAHAVGCAEEFADGENIAVLFADNILEDDLNFRDFKEGARIHLKEVPNPEIFGIAEIKGNKIISLEEKPKNPKSNYCIIGVYAYDKDVFDHIKTLKPSARGELEITDLNRIYLNKCKLDYRIIKGFWNDAGTFDDMLTVSNLIKKNIK